MKSVVPQKIFDAIKDYFHGDMTKTWAWFQTYNPSLGAIPLDMIKQGKAKKLGSFIDSRLKGYFP